MDDFEKLINASDLIEWIMETYPDWCVGDVRSIVDHVIDLPSVQTEIVRCKECKHYEFADNRAFGFPVRRCEWTGFEDIDENSEINKLFSSYMCLLANKHWCITCLFYIYSSSISRKTFSE